MSSLNGGFVREKPNKTKTAELYENGMIARSNSPLLDKSNSLLQDVRKEDHQSDRDQFLFEHRKIYRLNKDFMQESPNEKTPEILQNEINSRDSWLQKLSPDGFSDVEKTTFDHLNIAIIVTSVLCVIFSFTFVGVIVNQLHGETLADLMSKKHQEANEICLACDKLAIDTNIQADRILSKLSQHERNGRLECCAENTVQVAAMFEAIKRKRNFKIMNQNKLPVSDKRLPAVSLHKRLYPMERERNITGPTKRSGSEKIVLHLQPNYNDRQTEHARGVDVHESYIQINHSGLYYIYLGVHMMPKSNESASTFQEKSFTHYLHRDSQTNKSKSGILLRVAHTFKYNMVQEQETKYAGGVFYLDKFDKIHVCANGIGVLKYQKESMFIGMFMLESRGDSDQKIVK